MQADGCLEFRKLCNVEDIRILEGALRYCLGAEILVGVVVTWEDYLEVRSTHSITTQIDINNVIEQLTKAVLDSPIESLKLRLKYAGDVDKYSDQGDAAQAFTCHVTRLLTRTTRRPRQTWLYKTDGELISLENLYPKGSVFLVCNGPSLTNKNRTLLENARPLAMTVNNGGHLLRSQFWVAVDAPSRFMQSIWTDGSIQKFVPLSNFAKSINKSRSLLVSNSNYGGVLIL